MRAPQVLLVFFGFVLGSSLVLLHRALFVVQLHPAEGAADAAAQADELQATPAAAPNITTLAVTTAPARLSLSPSSKPTLHPTGLPSLLPTRAPTAAPSSSPSSPPPPPPPPPPPSSARGAARSKDELNVFISLAVAAVKEPSRLVLFSGKTTKKLLDQPIANLMAMVSLNGKVRTRTWADVARLVNKTFSLAGYESAQKAVHVHNEHKLGDFLEHVIVEHKKRSSLRGAGGKSPLSPRAAGGGSPARDELHDILNQGQAPIVVTNSVDENWGFFSTGIGSRTTAWINMTNHLLIHGANYDTVKSFLDSDKIVLVVCNTHVDPAIGAHEKIISLPLGISRKGPIFAKALALSKVGVKKKTLLQINNSGWGDRAFINRIVSEAFNGTVKNSYSGANTDENKGRDAAKKRRERLMGLTTTKRRRRLEQEQDSVDSAADHLTETAQAKFVLCPSGLGYDTYRLWETLLMGSIPIVESNAGFDRTYASLPVLVVRNYSDVTPELLTRAYPCFVRNAQNFKFDHLTEAYWLNLIAQAVVTGCIAHVREHHPHRNKFCSFL